MKKYFIYIFLLLSIFTSSAQESQDICVDYFTGENCLECSEADEYIENLEIHYENLSVNWYDIHLDKKFAGRLSDLFQQQNVPIDERQIPAAFIGEKYFVGEIQTSELENEIRNLFQKANVPCPEPLANSSDDNEILLPLVSIITAALVDSINPCAIAVLLLYNLFFVLPLLVISGLVYFGYTTVEDTNKWKNRNFKLFHLIIGLMMLALGILVVFEIL